MKRLYEFNFSDENERNKANDILKYDYLTFFDGDESNSNCLYSYCDDGDYSDIQDLLDKNFNYKIYIVSDKE